VTTRESVPFWIGLAVGPEAHHTIVLDDIGNALFDRRVVNAEADLVNVFNEAGTHGTAPLVIDQASLMAQRALAPAPPVNATCRSPMCRGWLFVVQLTCIPVSPRPIDASRSSPLTPREHVAHKFTGWQSTTTSSSNSESSTGLDADLDNRPRQPTSPPTPTGTPTGSATLSTASASAVGRPIGANSTMPAYETCSPQTGRARHPRPVEALRGWGPRRW
jgi:hypothetical protein